jgi:hypothetical protein
MKWLFFLLVFVFSCKSKNKTSIPVIKEHKVQDNVESLLLKKEQANYNYNDTVTMPSLFDPYADSGYFKGYLPEKIDGIEARDTTQLFRFLSNTINKKDIVLLNKETLSHSVFIDQKRKIRIDTLKNEQITIVSKYNLDEMKDEQRITINGVIIKDYNRTGVDSIPGDVFDLNEHSFRYFSFKGKKYYYIQASAFYSVGASMGNVCYHLIYDLANRRLSHFETCRFSSMLFGDVNGDSNLDYLDFDNSDFCTTVPYSDNVTIHLYSCNNKGNFVLQKDTKEIPYAIEGNTGAHYHQDSFIIKRSYWPVKLK